MRTRHRTRTEQANPLCIETSLASPISTAGNATTIQFLERIPEGFVLTRRTSRWRDCDKMAATGLLQSEMNHVTFIWAANNARWTAHHWSLFLTRFWNESHTVFYWQSQAECQQLSRHTPRLYCSVWIAFGTDMVVKSEVQAAADIAVSRNLGKQRWVHVFACRGPRREVTSVLITHTKCNPVGQMIPCLEAISFLRAR